MAQKPKTVRVDYNTWMALRGLRGAEDDDLDSVIQKLIRFYLKKPEESKKHKKKGKEQWIAEGG